MYGLDFLGAKKEGQPYVRGTYEGAAGWQKAISVWKVWAGAHLLCWTMWKMRGVAYQFHTKKKKTIVLQLQLPDSAAFLFYFILFSFHHPAGH